MIAIETEQGELVKVLKNVSSGRYGIHEQFGFISEKRASERMQTRKRQAYDYTSDNWRCQFSFKDNGTDIEVNETSGCQTKKVGNLWVLETPQGNFKITKGEAANINSLLIDEEDNAEWMNRLLEFTIIAIFVLTPILWLMQNKPIEEELAEEKEIEPVTVKIIQPAKTVNVQREESKPDIKVKPLTQAEKSKRAVQRNLGFLGMVGSKTVKDAVGGVPQDLKKATAGAGAGGDAGSGGEVLTNLGKGLKKTTVGNTGVAGLGGKLVTKGTSGGGKGGYGNTLVASGSGKGLSAIAVSSSDMVLEGGISRYAINATIAKYLNQVRRCYEAQLKTKPDIQGLVEMSFEINDTGMLNFARVNRTTLKDAPTEQCISKKMMTWQFPKPKGGVKVPVKYPFMLRPVGS